MEYDKDQLIANIKSELKSVISKYEFQLENDILFKKIKDDTTQIVSKYLAYKNSNYILKSGDIIVKRDEYDPIVTNVVFSDDLKKALYGDTIPAPPNTVPVLNVSKDDLEDLVELMKYSLLVARVNSNYIHGEDDDTLRLITTIEKAARCASGNDEELYNKKKQRYFELYEKYTDIKLIKNRDSI